MSVLTLIVVVNGTPAPGGRSLVYAALAGAGEASGIAALYRGLAVGQMTLVAPVAATAPALPVVAGLIAGEVPGPIASIGVVIAALGVAITSMQRIVPDARASRPAASVGYGLLASAGFGSFFIAMDLASESSVPWALLTARLTSVVAIAAATATAISLRRPSRLPIRRADLHVMALIGVLIVAADAMYAIATTRGLLGVAAVLGSLHTVVTIGLARIILAERLERIQHVGVVIVLLGVLAIAASPT